MRLLKVSLILLAAFAFASCDSECTSDLDFTAETRVESDNWKAATSKYDAEPTVENCEALNTESDKYTEALNGLRDCVLAIDLEDFLNTLAEIDAERVPRCQ